MFIVEAPFLVVEEDLIGLLGGLEAHLGGIALVLGDLVWMGGEGLFAVGFADLVLAGGFAYLGLYLLG